MNNNPYQAQWEKTQEQGQQLAQFYTPECLVDLCLELLQPHGELFDPCCGLGSFLLKAKLKDENLKISGNDLDANLGELPFEFTHGDYLTSEHKQSEFIIANIPFNSKKTHCDLTDENYCWIEKIITNTRQRALIILPSGVNSTLNPRITQKRKALIESGYLELVCQLPSHLFNQTGIAPCLWLINKEKSSKDMAFLTAEKFSEWKDKKRFLTSENIKQIVNKDNWNLVSYEKIKEQAYILVPSRYEPSEEASKTPEQIDQELIKHIYELRYSLHLLIADAYQKLLNLDKLEETENQDRDAPLANLLTDSKQVSKLQSQIRELMLERHFKHYE